MKYCEDCKWFKKGYCSNPKEKKDHDNSPVYKPTDSTCRYARLAGYCGVAGNLWEAKDAV